MGVNKQIEELLDKNKETIAKAHGIDEKDVTVVYDGIVDENVFERQDIKLLFLLKDVNGSMSSSQSIDYKELPSFISETNKRALDQGDEPTHWKALCYWTEAFKHPEKSFMDAEKCGKNLLEIAIVNIKKTPGRGLADEDELLDAANGYGAVIRKEIDMISPSVIICGGTYSYAKIIYKALHDYQGEKTMNCGAKCFTTKSGKKFVEFVHPGARVTLAATYAYAKELANELREKG